MRCGYGECRACGWYMWFRLRWCGWCWWIIGRGLDQDLEEWVVLCLCDM